LGALDRLLLQRMGTALCLSSKPPLNATSSVVRFHAGIGSSRYFSVAHCDPPRERLCLFFLSGQGTFTVKEKPHKWFPEVFAAARTSKDGGHWFDDDAVLVVPQLWRYSERIAGAPQPSRRRSTRCS
jgi:hypothetical protein